MNIPGSQILDDTVCIWGEGWGSWPSPPGWVPRWQGPAAGLAYPRHLLKVWMLIDVSNIDHKNENWVSCKNKSASYATW